MDEINHHSSNFESFAEYNAWTIRDKSNIKVIAMTPFFSLEYPPNDLFKDKRHLEMFFRQAKINMKNWINNKPLQRYYNMPELDKDFKKVFSL